MSSPSLPTLPLSVFSHVMEFALYGYSPAVLPSARSHPGKHLIDVGLVSKSWLHPVKQLMAQYEQETMEIHLEKPVHKTILPRQGVGAASSGLERYLGQDARSETSGLKAGPFAQQTPAGAVKGGEGTLRSIGESGVTPQAAVEGACAGGEDRDGVEGSLCYDGENIREWKSWRTETADGTDRNDTERHRSSTEFLDNVMKFCPNVEYLDGAGRACHGYDGVRCEDKWLVSLNTWEEFNKTCTKLREFQWTSVPFADPFFFAFSEIPKPQLERLDITANLLWSWKEYLRGCGDETAAEIKNRHGRHARGVEVVLAACPALKNLKVEIDLQKYTDSAVHHLDIDIYGDDFWASVAENCPLLETIAINNCANFEVMNVRPIETFTDDSLLSLAELENLYSVESNAAVMCTGDGIYEYMCQLVESNCYTGGSRMLDLRIGGQENGHFGCQHSTRWSWICCGCLSEISEEDFGAVRNRQTFEVFLSNPYHLRVSKQWSSKYMQEELRPLMKRVREMHPSVTVNASVNGVSGDSFSKIDMFTMSWRPEDKSRDMFWETEEDEYYTEDTPSDLQMPPGAFESFPGRSRRPTNAPGPFQSFSRNSRFQRPGRRGLFFG